MSARKPPKLVKGVDYYLEGTRFVFTSTYHLKRGFCCHSRCRHCPYGLSSEPSFPNIEIIGVPSSRPPRVDPAPPPRSSPSPAAAAGVPLVKLETVRITSMPSTSRGAPSPMGAHAGRPRKVDPSGEGNG